MAMQKGNARRRRKKVDPFAGKKNKYDRLQRCKSTKEIYL